jgi:hypothetical protein
MASRRPLSALPDDLLRFAAAVPVGRVDEIDSAVQGFVDDADAVVMVGIAKPAEHHRAKAIGADFDPGFIERAILHGFMSFSSAGLWPTQWGAPPREIADQPGVGVGALYRATFPSARTLSSRSSAATWTAEAAPTLAVEYDPRDLLIAGSSAPLISFAGKRGL